jgi:transposase
LLEEIKAHHLQPASGQSTIFYSDNGIGELIAVEFASIRRVQAVWFIIPRRSLAYLS